MTVVLTNGAAETGWEPTSELPAAECRARMLAAARQFFHRHDVLEVDTPMLSRSAVSDPNIESIRASLAVDAARDYFLHTSPEFAMKRLLCAGWPDIYQISKVFRDGELGRRHQPEFTMVEWYRRQLTLEQMMQHTVDFIETLLEPASPLAPARYLSYVDAFLEHAGVHALDDDIDTLYAASGADAALRASLGLQRDAWLDLLLGERIAAKFPTGRLTVLHHYPASQAALARLCPDEPRLADRFEVFFGALELANGYCELADAEEQRQRCRADQAARRQRRQPLRPLDERFLAALDHGLPPCCGVAVGFDRLLMINCNTDDIRKVMTFSFPE